MLNSTWIPIRDATEDAKSGYGGGAGNALNPVVLISAGVATFVATVVSVVGILFQLKVSDHRLIIALSRAQQAYGVLHIELSETAITTVRARPKSAPQSLFKSSSSE